MDITENIENNLDISVNPEIVELRRIREPGRDLNESVRNGRIE